MFPGDGFHSFDPPVYALVIHNAELYLAGEFIGCMDRATYYVARWNGRRWAQVGAWLDAPAYALALFDDFDDSNAPGAVTLYAGTMTGIYKLPADPNDTWPLIAGTDAPVRALAVFDGALYAGGEFTEIGGESAKYIARWSGTAWEAVGGGVERDPNDPPAKVLALTVFADGGGEALFAGGTFTYAGTYPTGVSAKRVARWRGNAWSALGDGIDDPNNVQVDAPAGWPAMQRLYVGGTFGRAGGDEARRIAAAHCDPNDPDDPNAWTWSAVGPGLRGRSTLDAGLGGVSPWFCRA